MKKYLSEVEYLKKLNEKLLEHPQYLEGMKFEKCPENAEGRDIAGISFIFVKNYDEVAVFADVAKQIAGGYCIK